MLKVLYSTLDIEISSISSMYVILKNALKPKLMKLYTEMKRLQRKLKSGGLKIIHLLHEKP